LADAFPWSSWMRPAAVAIASLLAAGVASAEPPPTPDTADVRRALIFTGHYSALERGAPDALLRKAIQSWQSANEMEIGDALPPEATKALLADGLKQRYAVGWAMLRDKAVGLEIGVPTKLVKYTGSHPSNSTFEYGFEGEIGYKLIVRYGDYNCATMNSFYARSVSAMRPAYAARQDDWFALASSVNGKVEYWKAICRPSAIALASVNLTAEQFAKHGVLVTAMADSFSLGRHFNSTAVPHPKIDEPPTRPADYKEGETPRGPKVAAAELPANVDGTGKIGALRLAARTGAELRTEQVFEQAGAAVYMVKAGDRQGSAVAIGENELLTNCHVVADMVRVTLVRDRTEIAADLVSKNVVGDRCVLRTATRLPKWVRARPYDNIRVGERAFTIGTPRGFELTVAEGIVSSKRVLDGRRYVQTSAPVSPGSSGGGLFDSEGQLLGITTFLIRDAQNLNFAIAADEYAKQ
jgi:S1-C subfamily serine protease